MKPNTQRRRDFLKKLALTTLGGSSALSLMSQLNFAHAATDSNTDYKALVCIFLYGGNDSFNMLIPRSNEDYATYANTRQTLAIDQNALLAIPNVDNSSINYGLHPSMPGIQQLFSENKLAFIANVGALIEPTTKDDYQQNRVALPPRLFSHNDQQDFIMSLKAPHYQQGWASQIADLMSNSNDPLTMNITLSGMNTWQGGGSNLPSAVRSSGVVNLTGINFEATGNKAKARAQVFQNILSQTHNNPFISEYAKLQSRSVEIGELLENSLESAIEMNTNFDDSSSLALKLQMIAKLISVRQSLGVSRQLYFVGAGGFDTHGDQLGRHTLLLSDLSNALKSFYDATLELGISEQVTTFTASDFGRTLTSNGDGTDHGWGGHQMVMGGSVNGGRIVGSMPSLEVGSDEEIGRGRVIPTTSIDQYAATLANWYGLSASQRLEVFPNLGNFNHSMIDIF